MIAGYYSPESNFTTRRKHRALHYIIQATTSEGLVQGPYVAARVGPCDLADARHQTYY